MKRCKARIAKIEYAGKMDVYNMEVEDTHSFLIEDGIVAHNCYDAIRYFAMSCPMATSVSKHTRGKHYNPFSWDTEG